MYYLLSFLVHILNVNLNMNELINLIKCVEHNINKKKLCIKDTENSSFN